MLIKTRRGWELPEAAATPEAAFRDRRRLMKAIAAGPILAAASPMASAVLGAGAARAAEGSDPTADLYPAERNPKYTLDRPLTEEKITGTYNNFYEFGSHKRIWKAAQKLPIRPWAVEFDGLVEEPLTVDFDDLVRKVALEERLYRLRCVEAWSMTIPWTGFPLADLVAMAKPLAGAKYLRMESFFDPDVAPGQKQKWYPWPYVEGLTMAEATNELAFVVTGAYGKPMAKQFGAPLRVHLPWKYGFKSAKSITRMSFVEKRPKTFWNVIQPSEYGFWANVNPDVPHPRWSQETEEFLATGERVPTQLYNGYGDYVAHMYEGMEGERLFM